MAAAAAPPACARDAAPRSSPLPLLRRGAPSTRSPRLPALSSLAPSESLPLPLGSRGRPNTRSSTRSGLAAPPRAARVGEPFPPFPHGAGTPRATRCGESDGRDSGGVKPSARATRLRRRSAAGDAAATPPRAGEPPPPTSARASPPGLRRGGVPPQPSSPRRPSTSSACRFTPAPCPSNRVPALPLPVLALAVGSPKPSPPWLPSSTVTAESSGASDRERGCLRAGEVATGLRLCSGTCALRAAAARSAPRASAASCAALIAWMGSFTSRGDAADVAAKGADVAGSRAAVEAVEGEERVGEGAAAAAAAARRAGCACGDQPGGSALSRSSPSAPCHAWGGTQSGGIRQRSEVALARMHDPPAPCVGLLGREAAAPYPQRAAPPRAPRRRPRPQPPPPPPPAPRGRPPAATPGPPWSG
jgi:hypothetical protein